MSAHTVSNTKMWLVFMLYLCHIAHGLMELQSMEIVSCANKNICHEDKNLRIVLKASTIETTPGSGSIAGIVTGGQNWNDSFGNWELLESLNIDINYHDAVWEYQLEDAGTFWTKTEELCGPFFTACSSYDNGVSCPDRGDYGLALIDATLCTKYAIENVEKWEATVSIQSTHLNLEWEASNTQHSLWNSNSEIYLTSEFDTSSCYQDLSNQYYVVVASGAGYEYYYFTSKQYWQDARNNFNLSVETWERDFDCEFTWKGWHTIIPFYETDAEYTTLGEGNDIQIPMSGNQLYAFSNGYIPSFYDDIMGTFSGDCSDNTTFTDSVIKRMGPPEDNKYIVSTNDIVDHFEFTLDLDYTQFVQMPTHAPTPNPTQFPTVPPTRNPSNSPTPSPTPAPTPLPTKRPTHLPTQPPTDSPTQSPTDTVLDTFVLYEIPAKLEIASTFPINISSETVQMNIIQSIACGLNYGREYIRLDSVDFITTISSRRLQADTENMVLGFTVFATSESDQSTYSTKLEETATYHSILASLTEKLPDTFSIFIANEVNHCGIGTKPITIAGQQQCRSICGLNQYYDAASTSCKDQVEWIVTTSTTKDTVGRMLYLAIGVGGWIATVGAIYAAYKCWTRSRNRSKTRKGTKKSIKRAVYAIGSTGSESSEFSEDEFKSMKRKFTASLTRAVKRKKGKKSTNGKKVRKSLLSQESSGESNTESSGSEFSTESNTESESDTSSQSSTESE